MADMERFEARLAASLERLADEVSTKVDAVELTSAIASAEARPGWLRALFGARGQQLTPTVRVALVVVAVLAVAFGMIVVAQRVVRTPLETTVHGRMACAGPSWASTSGPVALECTSELPDPLLAGPIRITLGETTNSGSFARFGSMQLDASGASWVGDVGTLTAPPGMVTGNAALVGSGDAAGLVLRFRLLSPDGVDWGLIGWIEEAE